MNLEETIADIASNISRGANYFKPGSDGYIKSTTSYYWVSSEQNPACVFQPANAHDVAIILTALSKADLDVRFAIKGGGHIAPLGFSSTTGILVDMVFFQQVIPNEDGSLVDVGPGLFWEDVYLVLKDLDPPRNVPGATTCAKVGVAGFNLGGGFSNLTNQFGLAIDAIRTIQVVIPSAKILTVDANNYGDLFWALKGGGNNFGIVTNWTMATHIQGRIQSMTLQYEPQYFEALIPVIVEFQKNELPKCNVEAVFEHTHEKGEAPCIASVECFFDGPEWPPCVFDGFLAIPHKQVNYTTTWMDRHYALPRNRQSYRVGLPSGKDDLPPFRGRFSCVMVSHYTPDLIQIALTLTSYWARQLAHRGGLQIYVDIWPFLPTMFDNSSSGGWPHEKGRPNGPLVINFKWLFAKDDHFWFDVIRKVTANLEAVALEQGVTTSATPVYYNLALDGTRPHDIYRENYQDLSVIRSKYDPHKVMDRTDGFRIEF